MLESWEFRILIGRIGKIIDYSDKHLDEMKLKADLAPIRKYSTECIGLGQLYPSVRRTISSGHYGRWIANIKGMDDYTVYEFSENCDPLRVRHINNGNCTEETYFFEYEDVVCAVPYVNIMNRFYSMGEVYCFIYDEGRLIEFSYITRFRVILYSFDNSQYPHVKLEKYDFDSEREEGNGQLAALIDGLKEDSNDLHAETAAVDEAVADE